MVFYWTVTSETQYSNKLPSKYHLGLLNDWYTNDIPNTICPLYTLPSILILFQHCIVYFRCCPIIIHVRISQFYPVNSVYKNNKLHKQTLKCLQKLGLTRNIRREQRFSAQSEEKKNWNITEDTQIVVTVAIAILDQAAKRDCKLAWISAFS